MAKKKSCCPEQTGGIPAWFMTYSDVITLLMTFFILLLTFATNEPEFFSKVKVVSFSGGGSTGVIGEADDLLDKSSIVSRVRPNSAAITVRGSETPPVYEDNVKHSVSRGLQSLQTPHVLADSERVKIDTTFARIRGADGKITQNGVSQLQLLAQQMRTRPLTLTIKFSDAEELDFCVTMAGILYQEFDVVPGRISVAMADITQVPDGHVHYLLSLSRHSR